MGYDLSGWEKNGCTYFRKKKSINKIEWIHRTNNRVRNIVLIGTIIGLYLFIL